MLADTRDLGVNARISQGVGKASVYFTAGRDFFRNRLVTGQNNITSNISVGANWARQSWFRVQSNVGVNWVDGDGSTVGDSRNVTVSVQPMLLWQRQKLNFTPLVNYSNAVTDLTGGVHTADTYSLQYSGRLTWQMPGHYRFSTFSLEGGMTRMHDNLTGVDTETPRLLVVWNITWDRRR